MEIIGSGGNDSINNILNHDGINLLLQSKYYKKEYGSDTRDTIWMIEKSQFL